MIEDQSDSRNNSRNESGRESRTSAASDFVSTVYAFESRLSSKSRTGRELEKTNSLCKLTDQQLINAVASKEIELSHLRLENKIFMNFLEVNDITELEGLENLIAFGLKKTAYDKQSCKQSMTSSEFVRSSTVSSGGGRRSVRYDSFSSLNSVFEGKGPRINLSQKSDMVLKAMEEIQTNLESFIKKSHRSKGNFKAELEECDFREMDIKDSIESFEFNILVQGVDRLTQRIPAEKFVRWMEEWLKSAQLNIEKLRLRTASLKIQNKKVSTTLIQRQELRENVHAVDFDQLEIENKHFEKKLELKNIQLIELKKMSGGAGLVLTNNKKEMRRQQDEYNGLKTQITEVERIITETENECDRIEEELDIAREKYEHFKKLTVSYKVPEVMEYVNIKRQLNHLNNQMKVWNRRKKIQDITINACLREMKNICGSSKIDRMWLEDLTTDSGID